MPLSLLVFNLFKSINEYKRPIRLSKTTSQFGYIEMFGIPLHNSLALSYTNLTSILHQNLPPTMRISRGQHISMEAKNKNKLFLFQFENSIENSSSLWPLISVLIIKEPSLSRLDAISKTFLFPTITAAHEFGVEFDFSFIFCKKFQIETKRKIKQHFSHRKGRVCMCM